MHREQILVRYGWQGDVGKFSLPDTESGQSLPSRKNQYLRGESVVIQSPRGLEMGVSLGACLPDDLPVGQLVRAVSPEDQLVHHQLRSLGVLAHERCVDWMLNNGIKTTLLEVEPLLDGQTLYFHFLSGVDDGVDDIVQQQVELLAQLYEDEVAASDFAQKVAKGCGPGCGTEQAAGRGCSSCTNCRICVART